MGEPFVGLLRRIDVARSSQEIGAVLMESVPAALDLTHPGMYLLDETQQPRESYLDVPTRFAHDYEVYGRAGDPIVGSVVRTHAPRVVRIDAIIESVRQQAFGEFIERHRPRHSRSYLVAPVLVGGRIEGMMQFVSMHEPARCRSTLTALALHVSGRLSVLRALSRAPAAHPGLTRRDLEVADIAARGFTNEETAKALGISPNTVKKFLRAVYRKLHISTRAELGRLLAEER